MINSNIARLILQAIIIITFARSIGWLFSFIKEPLVVAEMVAGILLGPTVMGRIPGFTENIFPPSSIPLLQIASQVGLLLFMFVVGLELDTKLLRTRLKSAIFSSVIGVAVPLVLTVPLVWLFYKPEFLGTADVSRGAFYLFLGIVLTVSALPVLARIISEYEFLNSPLGVFTMTATTVDDMIAWPILSLAVALAGAKKSITVLYIILLMVGDLVLLFVFCLPAYWLIARFSAQRGITHSTLFLSILVMLILSFYCEISGLTYLVGAFQAGIMVPRKNGLASGLAQKIEHIVVVIFMPLFFAVSGLRTQFAVLNTARVWGLTFLLTIVSLFGRLVSGIPCARFLAKLTWRDSLCFAVLMNTKGLVALVSVNLGIEYGIISEVLFAQLLIMVLINTCITGPLIALIDCIMPSAPPHPPESTRNDVALLCTHGNQSSATAALIDVASLLSTPQQPCDLLLFQILDAEEPSVYINPSRREKSAAAARTLAKQHGVKITTQFEASSNPIAHLKDAAQESKYIFALLPHQALTGELANALRESNRTVMVLIEADSDAAVMTPSVGASEGLPSSNELPVIAPKAAPPSSSTAPTTSSACIKPQVRLLMPVLHDNFASAEQVLEIILRMLDHQGTERVELVFVTIAPRDVAFNAARDALLSRILSSRGIEAVWREVDSPHDVRILLAEIEAHKPTHVVLPMDNFPESWTQVVQSPPVAVLLVRPELKKEKIRDVEEGV